MATENPFVKLFSIDFKDHVEVKKSGNTELKYVSWAYAWAEVKKLYPAASYEVKKFNGLPYVYDLSLIHICLFPSRPSILKSLPLKRQRIFTITSL